MADTVKLVRMIGLERLRLLLALDELGTLKAAADALHISTSAASQQLATLAREAGAPLTEVDGRRLRLTDAGRVLVDHGHHLFARLERAEADVQAAVAGELGELTVGSFPSIIPSLLVPAFTIARERYPRLRVNIREITAPSGLDELASGTLDVVVGVESDTAPAAADPRRTRLALGTERLQLALPAAHPLAAAGPAAPAAVSPPPAGPPVAGPPGAGPPVDLAALAEEDWVGTPASDACDDLLDRACAQAGFHPRVRHRAADWLAILGMVGAGMGVALVPRSVPAPRGVVLRPVAGGVTRRLYAATRRGAEARPAVAAYLDVLRSVPLD